MLVLTRRLREQVVIGDHVVVTNLGTPGRDKVRLGIDAPDDVSIVRRELMHGSDAPPTSLRSGQDLPHWSHSHRPKG